jgi:hypothetical protein
MRAALATQPGSPDAANEDWAGVLAAGLAVVLDGLSAPDGTGTGCRHGTPWYVSQLGPRLLALAADPARSLADALAEAIRQVAGLHSGCDLHHPGTPSPPWSCSARWRSGPITWPWPTRPSCSTPRRAQGHQR